jgi:hypothetical protein
VEADLHASFSPSALGARTALTLSMSLSGGSEGVPAPVRRIVIHLPAGLGLDLRDTATCATARLRARGPNACPARSLVGRGHAVVAVHAGSQTIPESASISIVRIPDRGDRHALQTFSQGYTPLDQQTISTAVVSGDGAPYGLRLTVSVPSIPSLMLEPDASIVSMSLTVGAVGGSARSHPGAITVPASCTHGFAFGADFGLADGTSASTTALVPCP